MVKDRKLGAIYHKVALDVLPKLAAVQRLEDQHPQTTYCPQVSQGAASTSMCCQKRFCPDGTEDLNGQLMVLILSEHFQPQYHLLQCDFDTCLVTPTFRRSTQFLLAVDVGKEEQFRERAEEMIFDECSTDVELAEAGRAWIFYPMPGAQI